jgi:hypothetical protein
MRRAAYALLSSSRVLLAGLVVLGLGGGMDVLYHLSPAFWEARLGAASEGLSELAHLVTAVGIVTTLIGLRRAKYPGRVLSPEDVAEPLDRPSSR